MEPLFEEYLANRGTTVKPYYWLSFSPDCSDCPYHIRTGEEARVSYAEFYQIFGFPYGPTHPQTKHLLFYELKTSSGRLVQKGHVSSCTANATHPESMLFERNGYLDVAAYNNDGIRHIVLYSSSSPCNEAAHCCVSKMYNFLVTYPDVTLSVYFSQLYHTDPDFPASAWNWEALRSLASLGPRVTLSPISGGIWHFLLHNFVNGFRSTVFPPILKGRALADRRNAYEISAITGVKPHFTDVLSQTTEDQDATAQAAASSSAFNSVFPAQSLQVTSAGPQPGLMPDLRVPVVFVLVPVRDLPPIHVGQNPYKPRNVVRHLNMPQMLFQDTKDLQRPATATPLETVDITEQSVSNKADGKKKKGKGRNNVYIPTT
ncbi:putative C-_U-editing enzyme APOBEC-4 [Artibeus jamaicensis]|uniref:putative C->U-editing enzyme APOBEC-4 n=1 Tax=Artibeus jamaicensis TaxID=9417 RepID=UPI00235AB3CD|nr:putative C->U-editing enzyme APOBEC-4 [Artibeus jamaicensis]